MSILLRQVREAAGLTQADVARRAGTPKSEVARIETHAEKFALSAADRIARVLGKTLRVVLVEAK